MIYPVVKRAFDLTVAISAGAVVGARKPGLAGIGSVVFRRVEKMLARSDPRARRLPAALRSRRDGEPRLREPSLPDREGRLPARGTPAAVDLAGGILLGLLAGAALATSSLAAADCIPAIGSPGGAASATACAAGDPSGASAAISAHAGAYDAANALAAGPSGVTVSNVPFLADRLVLGPSGPELGDSELVGPTPIQSSLGTGGLTAGLTPDGTIAVLSWPNPSYFNQMQYLTLSRGYPRGGAAANQGAFAGLEVALPDGRRSFSWLRDWPSIRQRYRGGASNALETVFSRDGTTVTQTAVVDPRDDVMTIRYEVAGARDPKLVFFENLNPADHKIPWGPGQDNLLWQANDFGAFWQRDQAALLHFRPLDADPGKFLNVIEGSPEHAGETLANDLSEVATPGVAFAITARPAPAGHQVGVDAAGLLGAGVQDLGGGDAYWDASERGAALSGGDAAFGQVDAAIAVAVVGGIADVIIAAAHTTTEAAALARATTFDGALGREERYWSDWLAPAALPAASANLDVDRRALVAIRNAAARSTGAMVASIARQTPYAEDWTRDGAFFNYALELAGHPEMVEAHDLFYARVQRANGTWGTMYYADGEEGGPFLYEIDQQGLATWTLWQHYVFAGARDYLDAVYPAIRRSADWMAAYANPLTARQGPAEEDDSFVPSDGLQGAVTVWMGLESAIEAARVEGDTERIAPWRARADGLKASILSEYWPNGRFHPGSPGYGQGLGYRGDFNAAAWILWPAGLLDPADPSERRFLESLAAALYDYLDTRIPLDSGAAGAPILFYDQKGIQSLAVYLESLRMALPQGDHARDPGKVERWIDFYHTALPTPTLHYGEQIWQTSPGRWADRVDMPHVWSGILVYLDAMALTRPDLVRYRPWRP